jgi:hypothetical protein
MKVRNKMIDSLFVILWMFIFGISIYFTGQLLLLINAPSYMWYLLIAYILVAVLFAAVKSIKELNQ